ncbi:hypothetical protein Pint_23110 [Pistacia integerrima]|uniref:Uncharacterized protein n=1 Tax=Pistacia integerrima TaxID=434235 RepID=A0ACC0YIK1_9ROSI|nr:hypothetical protein Pint_23110 [Pistacia integerrima]
MLMRDGLVASKELDSKPLLLSNLRTTKMNDDVLAIVVSPDAKTSCDVWCLAISNSGDYIVTGSHDRSIRHWDRTEEPISLSGVPENAGRERKEALEEMFESTLTMQCKTVCTQGRTPEEGAKKKNWIVLLNMRKRKPRGNVAEFQPDIRMLGLSPSHYVLRTLSNVKTNDLEQTLPEYNAFRKLLLMSINALPFADALKLLSYLKDWASNPDKVILFALWNI